jgi:hypothetical protein
MKKADREDKIMKLARDYANSGKFTGWLAIEWELRSNGYTQARKLLDDERTREELDDLCKRAISRANNT